MSLKFKIIFHILITLPIFASVIGIFGLVSIYIYFAKDLPDHEVLQKYEPAAVTRVHAGDGKLLAEYASQNRSFIAVGEIPQRLINAFTAAEDKNFYSHAGVDGIALARAVVQNVKNLMRNKRLIGASTITQQVAKNFLVGNAVSIERKIREAILAFRIETSLNKDKIMELYLNEIYLGYGSYGIAAAALNYFNKSLQELQLHEIAYLAALPKGPGNYHPHRRKAAAIIRRNWVLKRMYEENHISYADMVEAESHDLQTYARDIQDPIAAAYFLEETRKEAATAFGADVVNEGGLSVRTTLDTELQNILVENLRQGLLNYDKRHGYRGAIAEVGDFDKPRLASDWQAILRQIIIDNDGFTANNPYFWDVAVILSATDSEADIGIVSIDKDGVISGGKATSAALKLENIRWARRALKNGRRGGKLKSFSQILKSGDVIFVSLGKDGYELQQVPELQGAGVILDPHNGRVLAMTGGWDFRGSEFNRATQARRQPGSAFKPFVYLAGLEEGLTPISPILDAPFVLEQAGGRKWKPSNFSRKFYGISPMYLGIEKSRNLMTVRLAQSLGMEKIAEVAGRFGIQDNMPYQLSMSLGAGETGLLKLATAYAMLVNGGKEIRTTLIDQIQDRHGRTIFKHDRRACPNCIKAAVGEYVANNDLASNASGVAGFDGAAFFNAINNGGTQVPKLADDRATVTSPQNAYQVVTMLERVVLHGTGKSIKELKRPLAGKTGTTNDSYDAWFVGFAPDLVVGIFTGFDIPRTLGLQPSGAQETGSSVAAPIFKEVMRSALADKAAVPFRTPNGISFVLIDNDTNEPATPQSTQKTSIAFTSEYAERHFNRPSAETDRQAPASEFTGGGLY